MSDMGSHTRLTKGQRRALTFAVCVVIAGMGMGFASSFTTLYGAATAHHWTAPALLPLSVDSGIVAYVVLDHLAVTLGSRSRWLHLAAWSLAAFTVWANAAVSPADGSAWRVIHAAMPALWVLGVEALRFMWHRLHQDPASVPDRIPAGRWLASPVPTFFLWRRMRLLNVTSWNRMAALEDARLCIRDRIRAACEADPELRVPDALKRVVRTGRLPAAIVAAVDLGLEYGGPSRAEDEAGSWTDARLTLRDQVTVALETRRRDIAQAALPAPTADPSPEVAAPPPEGTVATPARKAPKRAAKPAPRRMSDDDLMAFVYPLLSTDPGTSIGAVMKATGTGRERARKLLERAQDEERQQRMVRVK